MLSSQFVPSPACGVGFVVAAAVVAWLVASLRERKRELHRTATILRCLVETHAQEKRRLCDAFHDGVMQYAIGSLMMLEAHREQGPAETSGGTVDTVIDLLRKGIVEGRRTMRGIEPAALRDLGLEAGGEEMAESKATAGVESRPSPGGRITARLPVVARGGAGA